MNKKQFGLFTLLFLIAGTMAEAQQPVKVYKIGLLLGFGGLLPSSIEAFRQGLREFGYLEGQNIAVEYRVYERTNRLADLAAELVQLKVDVIVANSTEPALAAKKTTKSIPIVFASVSDPVGAGLVTSLARPGGNVTGLTQFAPELGFKRLELLKEVVPRLSRVAVLWSSDRAGQKPQMEEIELAANALRLRLQPLDVPEPPDFEALFHSAIRGRANAFVALASPRFTSHQAQIVGLATKNRLPSVYVESNWVEAGGLMSYGPNTNERWRRASYYVDKILKGTKPADLPIEQPLKFEFVINLKAAKQIGLTVPPEVLARANIVIK
jgi:putative tryptophan/tyrosine transport system substrate-binding protein